MHVDKITWRPEIIFVDEDSSEDPLAARVVDFFRDVECVLLKSGQSLREIYPRSNTDLCDPGDLYSAGKRIIHLSRYRGRWLKHCPGTKRHICCNLHVVNPIEGCPMDCSYCCLQWYLRRNPVLKIHTNICDMFDAIARRAEREPSRLFRICTGELGDSLALDHVTGFTSEFLPKVNLLSNVEVELKTKSDRIENLLLLPRDERRRVVVSWSVNSEEIANGEEHQTVSLAERITAAERLVEIGYRVGFHFDPLVLYTNWKDGYRAAIGLIFENIRPENVAWVSIAALRYPRAMQEIFLRRFPDSKLPLGEFVQTSDGKLRYPQPLRFELLRFVWRELKAQSPQLPVYMCMESPAAWRSIAEALPHGMSELREVYSKALPCSMAISCGEAWNFA